MINFFKAKNKTDDDMFYYNIAALLIHTAKIDENYEKEEKVIIRKALIELGVKSSDVDTLVSKAETIEENSNQILNFTKEVKSIPQPDKIKIVETLWKIIYSNNNADIYETNLMRRLTGLLYIDAKIMGDIKEKAKKEFKR